MADIAAKPSAPCSIGIIGGGFTGTMLAVQLMRRADFQGDILLFDGRGVFGRGLAYSTSNPDHLLNVRVANMSAFEDDPADFIRWLWRMEGRLGDNGNIPPSVHAFASRATYGAYIQDVFQSARQVTRAVGSVITVSSDVTDLAASGSGVRLTTAAGESFDVDRAVLCIGNFQPSQPLRMTESLQSSKRYIADPWDEAARDRIGVTDSITIIGTGLTMIDVVIDFAARGHSGPITAISRHGLIPQAHALARPYPAFLDRTALPVNLVTLMRLVRREILEADAKGFGWRSVIDSMRPFVQDLWMALPISERRRFLMHLRSYWDVHRHRMAEQIAEQFDALRQSGQMTIAAGRVVAADLDAGKVSVSMRPRGGDVPLNWQTDWLINCAGSECDYAKIHHPLVQGLLASGQARPDRLILGLEVSPDLALIGRDDRISPFLFALGPPTRGALWEITAVPDIRKHCARLAAILARCMEMP